MNVFNFRLMLLITGVPLIHCQNLMMVSYIFWWYESGDLWNFKIFVTEIITNASSSKWIESNNFTEILKSSSKYLSQLCAYKLQVVKVKELIINDGNMLGYGIPVAPPRGWRSVRPPGAPQRPPRTRTNFHQNLWSNRGIRYAVRQALLNLLLVNIIAQHSADITICSCKCKCWFGYHLNIDEKITKTKFLWMYISQIVLTISCHQHMSIAIFITRRKITVFENFLTNSSK